MKKSKREERRSAWEARLKGVSKDASLPGEAYILEDPRPHSVAIPFHDLNPQDLSPGEKAARGFRGKTECRKYNTRDIHLSRVSPEQGSGQERAVKEDSWKRKRPLNQLR